MPWLGTIVRNVLLDFVVPVISWPVIVTWEIWPLFTCAMNSLNWTGVSFCWNLVETFQITTPTTTSTSQNRRLFTVEFMFPLDLPKSQD